MALRGHPLSLAQQSSKSATTSESFWGSLASSSVVHPPSISRSSTSRLTSNPGTQRSPALRRARHRRARSVEAPPVCPTPWLPWSPIRHLPRHAASLSWSGSSPAALASNMIVGAGVVATRHQRHHGTRRFRLAEMLRWDYIHGAWVPCPSVVAKTNLTPAALVALPGFPFAGQPSRHRLIEIVR